MKPLCGFCGGHHYGEEPHPSEAVREALAKLRAGPEPGPGFGVGHDPTESPPVTVRSEPEPVTKSVVTKATVTKGRPRMEHPSPEALRRRKYREHKEA